LFLTNDFLNRSAKTQSWKSATEEDSGDGGASQKENNVAELFTYFPPLTQQAQKIAPKRLAHVSVVDRNPV